MSLKKVWQVIRWISPNKKKNSLNFKIVLNAQYPEYEEDIPLGTCLYYWPFYCWLTKQDFILLYRVYILQTDIWSLRMAQMFITRYCILRYFINSLAPGIFEWNFRLSNFRSNFSDWHLRYLLWNCPQIILTGPYWWKVNIGSGNGLVLPGNKPLHEPMLPQFCVATWSH